VAVGAVSHGHVLHLCAPCVWTWGSRGAQATCPLHVLGPLLAESPVGHRPFSDVTAADALKTLRVMLVATGVPEGAAYRTHDLRRGHAKDLQLSGACGGAGTVVSMLPKTGCACRGAPLYEILAAGQWASPAFLAYIDANRLEEDLVLQAHVDESDEDVVP